MRVVYSDVHRLHRPQYEFAGGRQVAHPDVPERVEAILAACRRAGWPVLPPREYGPEALRSVHSDDYLEYLQTAYTAWVARGREPAGVIPGTFPIRPTATPPEALSGRAGYYCLDTETAIASGTFQAAAAAACSALTAADLLAEGERSAYALCRPPGHHAGRDYCGGYCYLNNAALAADRLAERLRVNVAVLDLDAHHGNGTQDIFYDSDRVFFASIHADPNVSYPYYWGRADETGTGKGLGCTLNLPLLRSADEVEYLAAVERALDAIESFSPRCLVVSLGTDTAAGDRLGAFALSAGAFGAIGHNIAEMGLPVMVVQEGGYEPDSAGRCVTAFLEPLCVT